MRTEAASDEHVDEIEALLVEHGLPTAGLRDQFPAAYAIAIELGVIVGCAGLETYGDVGLLRSLAVSAHRQSQGIGRVLVANRLDDAKARKLDAVYLLTRRRATTSSGSGSWPRTGRGYRRGWRPARSSPVLARRRRRCLALAL